MPVKRNQAGVTLIEVMVALVIALIVSSAAIAFIASIMRANAATLSSSRLNAELRSNAEIVSRELRRARFVADPIADIGSGCIGTNSCASSAVSAVTITGNCVRFSYDTPQGRRFQAIRMDAGQLKMGWSGVDIACAAATTRISSEQLTLLTPASGSVFESINANSIRLRLRGRYNANGLATDKTYSTIVAIRSGGV